MTDLRTSAARLIVACSLTAAGALAMIIAVFNERRMQRNRRPGVTYLDVTLRRDGAWRNESLFTEAGLRFQRRASAWGVLGTVCWIAGLLAWILLPADG